MSNEINDESIRMTENFVSELEGMSPDELYEKSLEKSDLGPEASRLTRTALSLLRRIQVFLLEEPATSNEVDKKFIKETIDVAKNIIKIAKTGSSKTQGD